MTTINRRSFNPGTKSSGGGNSPIMADRFANPKGSGGNSPLVGGASGGNNALENLLTGGGGGGGKGSESGPGGNPLNLNDDIAVPKIFGNDQNMTEEERCFQEQEAQEQFFMELLRGKQTRLVRERLLRRLIFEQNFRREMKVCFIFLVNMISFMILINMAYPSSMISPVHEYLVQHFGLPLDVNNLDELSETLKSVAIKSRFFSPGSNLYTNDFYSHVYLSSPAKFPPNQLVPFKEQPKLLPNMTLTSWLKSTSRLDTIIEKKRVFSGGYQICWRFGLEEVYYGLHEGPKSHHVVNPLAARVHQEGADEEAEWRTSASRRKYNTGTWHHFAVTIENGIDFQFYADGVPTTKAHGSYVLTDCPDGTVYLGSERIETELQGISFYPRILEAAEIVDVMEIGMPLANFLAARSPPVSRSTKLDELAEWSGLKSVEDAASETRIMETTHEVVRHLSSFLIHHSGLSSASGNGANSGSYSSSGGGGGGHRRLLESNSEFDSKFINPAMTASESDSSEPASESDATDVNLNEDSINIISENVNDEKPLSPKRRALHERRGRALAKAEKRKSVTVSNPRRRALAGASGGGTGTNGDDFSPKAQYQILHTADWSTCTNAQHHTCEVIMLHGTKKRLAGKFAKVMSDYGEVEADLAKWCTDNVGIQDGVNANYTYAQCVQLIGGFKDHPDAAYYTGSSSDDGGGHRKLKQIKKGKKTYYEEIENYNTDVNDLSFKTTKLFNARQMIGSEISLPPVRRILESSRKLAGSGGGGNNSSLLYHLEMPDTSLFHYPIDSTFGLAMKCMELPTDVTEWVDNADQLAHDVTDISFNNTYGSIFEGVNTVFDKTKEITFENPDVIWHPTQTVGGGSYLTLTAFNCTDFIGDMPIHEKHFLEHYALMYFRVEEYYQCTHDYAFMHQCQKDCGECGMQYAPSEYDVLDAIISCEDDMLFRDWDDKGCAWYYTHDYGCNTYGTQVVRDACIATCNVCDPALKAIDLFDLDFDQFLIYHELNAFFVSAREPQHKVTLHNKKSMVVFLCCNKIFGKDSEFSDTCDSLEHDGLLYDDAMIHMEDAFTSETESQYQDFLAHAHESVQGWPYELRHHIPKVFIDPCVHTNFDNDGKMHYELLIGKNSGFRKAVDDGVATFETLQKETRPVFAIDQQHSLVAENFQVPKHMPNQQAMTMEQITYVFQECTKHSDCYIDDYVNSADVYPHACSLIENDNELELLYSPNNCTRYDKRHYLFCSNKCLTGACGAKGSVEWGAKNTEVEGVVGWCQPCNGCVNTTFEHGTFKAYGVDGLCPAVCASDGEAVPEHHAADPLVIHTPNALGGWSVATWVKQFQYQWILRKQIHFDHDHPNHRWEGFTTKTLQIEHVDMYLPTECKHIDGIYNVIAPLHTTGMLVKSDEHARLQFRHVGQYDYWQIISMDPACVKSTWTPPGARLRRQRERQLAAAAASASSGDSYSGSEDDVSATREYDENTMKILLSWQSTNREKPYQDPLASSNALWLEELGTVHNTYDAPHSLDELIRVHSKSGELVCWRVEVSQICFRNKWYERKLTCVENPLLHYFTNSDEWHHLVVAKKGEQWTEYDQAHVPPRPVYSDREDHIEFFVDGIKEVLGVGLQSGLNAVPPFGLPDCGGPLQTQSQIHAKAMDFYQGPQFKSFNKLHYASDISKESVDSLREFFPMYKVLPIGGKDVITAFTFEGVEIGKNAYLHESHLELTAADLISNYMFEDLNCIQESTSSSQTTSTITFEIYGLTNTSSLSELEKIENPCYLFSFLKNKKSAHKVEWKVSVAAWELDSIFGQASYASGSKRRDGHHLPDKRSPDLNPILEDLLEQDLWAWGESVTLMIVEQGKVDTSCNCDEESMTREVVPLQTLEDEMRHAKNGCEFIEHLRNPLNSAFGLFVQPFEDRYHPDGHLARLTVTWCLNSKCVSPQFLGGGSDVKYQGADAISEKLVYWMDNEDSYAVLSGRNISLTNEVCFSYIDGSEYDCYDRCPTQDYSHDWDIIGTFDCKNAEHQSAFQQAKADMQSQAISVARRLEQLEALEDEEGIAELKEIESRNYNPYLSKKMNFKTINDPVLVKKRASASMPRDEYERLIRRGLKSSNGEYHEMKGTVVGRRLGGSQERSLAGGAGAGISSEEITALDIGELALQGIRPEGVVFDMRFVSRSVVASEIQELYNHELALVKNLPGPELMIRRDDPESVMVVSQYKPELVSVIPPVILQVRIQSQSCKETSPGMAEHLYAYLHKQLEIICEQSYMCQYPTATLRNVPDPLLHSGYICRDRSVVINDKLMELDPATGNMQRATYWEKNSIDVEGVGDAYPEFLDMYTQEVIFRNKEPHDIVEWIDAQTHDVVVMNVFYTPIDRLATVFKIEWMHDTSGKFHETHDIVSFVQMNKDEQQIWIYIGIGHAIVNVLMIFVVLFSWNTRRRNRNAWYARMLAALESNISNRFRKDPNIRLRVWQKVKEHISLFHKSDFCDILLALAFLINYVFHFSHYYSPDLAEKRIGLAEEKIQSLLEIPWDSHDIVYEEKVQMFLEEIKALKTYNSVDTQLRYIAMLLMVAAFVRIMFFLKVHPRVAVLYETLKLSASPLLHFTMVCALLILQLGFISFMNFGHEIPEYSSFGKGIYYSSLTMANKFVLQEHTHISTTYAVYIVFIIILIPIIVINVARAIIINAFAMVNAKSRVFQPESNVFADFYYCVIRWPIMRRIHFWKNHSEIIEDLFALELNTEITITELSSRQMMIDQHVLKAAKIFKTEDDAEKFLVYYAGVKDKLQVDSDNNSYDEHEQLLMDLVELHSYCNTLGNKSSSTQGKSDGSASKTGEGAADKKSAFLETDPVSGSVGRDSADQASKGGKDADFEETQEMMKDLKKQLKQLTRQAKNTKAIADMSNSADTNAAANISNEKS